MLFFDGQQDNVIQRRISGASLVSSLGKSIFPKYSCLFTTSDHYNNLVLVEGSRPWSLNQYTVVHHCPCKDVYDN